jgi:hypothetical protein
VLRFDELLVAANRQTLRVGKGFLKLGGEFIDTHDFSPVFNFSNIP